MRAKRNTFPSRRSAEQEESAKPPGRLPTPFNFKKWIGDNAALLNPPVGNKLLFENAGMVVQNIGGPNRRVDFHDDPVEEFFYQLKGDMILKIMENGQIVDVRIREGEVFLAPAHLRHSPQRPVPGSFGLVVESARRPHDLDGFEWYCFGCRKLVHRIEVKVTGNVRDLPPLFAAFYADRQARTCTDCGTVHPGEEPPDGWVNL